MFRKSILSVSLVSGALVFVTLSGACGNQDRVSSDRTTGGSPKVVATTTQIGDFVRQVGGDAVDEHQILQPNSDPHDYEPRPADVEAVTGAILVFVNGDNLDSWINDIVSTSGGNLT